MSIPIHSGCSPVSCGRCSWQIPVLYFTSGFLSIVAIVR